MENPNKKFWDTHGRVGLVWSNRNANDDVLIAAALLRPNFHLLLDIACHFGLSRLIARWEEVRSGIQERNQPEELRELKWAEPIVERCLGTMKEAVENIEKAEKEEVCPNH